ncbi:MAG TPA: AsmA family protein, partial [Myxococcaceae bacterium]|nr:AsmA family protein [Myxococcaceae bacterium]
MTSAPPRKSRALTWLKRLGIGFLSILGLVILLLVVAFAYLTSPAGGEKLRGIALDKVNQSIRGQLSAERLVFSGNRLVLHGVMLKDPEGDPVATIEVLEVRVDLLALLHRTAAVTSLKIVGPKVRLRSDQRGMNLVRAIESRNPTPVAAPTKAESNPSRFIVKVLRFELSKGSFTFVQSMDEGERQISLEELHALGSLEYESPSGNLAPDLELEGKGQVSEKFVGASERAPQPVSGPVHIVVHGKMADGKGKATAAIEFPGLQLDAMTSRSGG